jgi:pSer/pThr/pTyr-binding forkhead associated (FHA) protein
VSEKHVLMVNERKGYVLLHLGFWNPPKINDRPVNSALLKEGDTVQIGDFHFVFHAAESE